MGVFSDLKHAFRDMINLPADALGPGDGLCIRGDYISRDDLEKILREAGIKASVFYSRGDLGIRSNDNQRILDALARYQRQ